MQYDEYDTELARWFAQELNEVGNRKKMSPGYWDDDGRSNLCREDLRKIFDEIFDVLKNNAKEREEMKRAALAALNECVITREEYEKIAKAAEL